MLRVLPIAALIGLLSPAAAPSSTGPPPLCRVLATHAPSFVPWLSTITVTLRPECPPNGTAQVRLYSDAGASDPSDGWLSLTPCTRGQEDACVVTWHGVVLRPLNWRPQWRSASGRAYDIPLTP